MCFLFFCQKLYAFRSFAQAQFDIGEGRVGFREDTKHIREKKWRVDRIPEVLLDRFEKHMIVCSLFLIFWIVFA